MVLLRRTLPALPLSPGSGFRTNKFSESVDIFVGHDEEKFVVHSSVLIKTSEYFRRILSNKSEGEDERELRLAGEDASAFEIFLYWLYAGYIPRDIIDHETIDPEELLVHAYLLGQTLESPDFRNVVVDAFARWACLKHSVPSEWAIQTSYEDDLGGSKLSALFVDMAVWHGPEKLFRADVPVEFWRDVVTRLNEKRFSEISSRPKPFLEAICSTYHDHEDGKETCIFHLMPSPTR